MCDLNSKKLCQNNGCQICFDRSFISHLRAINWSDKNNINPRVVFKSSNFKYWFNCTCGHEFKTALNNITSGKWCPYCANKKLCNDYENCMDCFNKSFQSHEKSKHWSNKNNIDPRNVFKNSDTKYWFNCNMCFHEFDCNLSNIDNNKWCPYCSNPPKLLCNDYENCMDCFNNSFQSEDKSEYWSDKNNILPRMVFKNSGIKYWFNCNICHHEFETTPHNVTGDKWCPYCANQKLCTQNCMSCFNKSFQSHEKSKHWSIKNDILPRLVFKNSNKKYWFNCELCKNDFNNSLNNISGGNQWCPHCKHKTEIKLSNELIKEKYNIEKQVKFTWCKNLKTDRFLPFDFVIEKFKIIIELDGPQHFIQVSNWKSPEETQKLDRYKMKCANKNGYTVIRILQEDVLKNRNNWLNNLKQNIINYPEPQRVYICNNNEYDCYLADQDGLC